MTDAPVTALRIREPLTEADSLSGGLTMIIGHHIWSGGALPAVVTLVGWLMVAREQDYWRLTRWNSRASRSLELRTALYCYIGGTLALGLYLPWAGSVHDWCAATLRDKADLFYGFGG